MKKISTSDNDFLVYGEHFIPMDEKTIIKLDPQGHPYYIKYELDRIVVELGTEECPEFTFSKNKLPVKVNGFAVE
jgi:hypothetical protein